MTFAIPMPLTRRQFLSAASAATLSAQPRRKPNIVLLVADDLGYGELGCQGNPEIPTPHIDSIARDGIRFTNGYVTAPFCTPSRAGFMTGRYQTRFGHEMNAVGDRNLDEAIGLPLTETTLAARLKAEGYATACFGKWHLGGHAKYHPLNRGFDEFYGFLHEGHYYVAPPFEGVESHLRAKEPPYDANNPLLRGREKISEREYLTDAFAREAEAFIGRNQAKPFFLYVPWNAVHSPMQATQASQQRFAAIGDQHRRVFAGMLSAMDEGIGRILRALATAGLEQDTIVFFISDNGGPTAELTSSNKPLRGGKGQLFEGGIRIPFLMRWSGHWKGGQVVNEPAISLDIVPTVLAAVGMKHETNSLDGVDLTAALGDRRRLSERTLYWRYGKNVAVRQGRWKLVRQGGAQFQLFDLDRDIAETTDLKAKESEVAARLAEGLARLDAQMAPPRWT